MGQIEPEYARLDLSGKEHDIIGQLRIPSPSPERVDTSLELLPRFFLVLRDLAPD